MDTRWWHQRPRAAGGDERGDGGFTLVETVVSVFIVSVVLLAVGVVLVSTTSGTRAQGTAQAAGRLLTDAVDRVHGFSGAGVVKGRDAAATATQWAARSPQVSSALTDLVAAVDVAAKPGSVANLPTTPQDRTVGGMTYTQNFYVAVCNYASNGTCRADAVTGSVPMFAVVVSVTYRDRSCPRSQCATTTSVLTGSTVDDAVFNTRVGVPGPTLAAIPTVTTDVGIPVRVPVVVSGGAPPVTVSPPSAACPLAFDASGTVLVGTPGAVGTSTCTVTATDGFVQQSTTDFTVVVNAAPTVATSPTVAVVALQSIGTVSPGVTGGTGDKVWTATSLPAGVSIDRVTGALTGTWSASPAPVPPTVVTVTDAVGGTASGTVSWTVGPALTVTTGAQRSTVNLTITPLTLAATGGSPGGYTWTVTGLPRGLTATTAGVVSGRPTTRATSTVSVLVTDTRNHSTTVALPWVIS